MFNIQSPSFSSCSKIDIASKLSPMFRNKRVASGQELANPTCHWNRTNSCKKLDSPSKTSQKHRKRSHNSQQRVYKSKINFSHNLQISNGNHNMVEQLNTLKNQYTNIKIAYQELINNKIKNDEENKKNKQQIAILKEQNEKYKKENQKIRAKVIFLEMEVERIKKQSLKLIQIQQFKALKLQQNLVEKQKAISSLIQSLKLDSSNIDMTPIPTTESEPIAQNPNNLNISQRHIESLTLSQDKTLSNSQFISISLTSMMENESQYRHELSTRRNINGLTNLSINYNHSQDKDKDKGNNNNISIVEHPLEKQSNGKELEQVNLSNYNSGGGKQNQNKIIDTFKKFRKEISKKIEVNVEDRTKQIVQHKNLHNLNSNLDRKSSKSHKSSKTKLKRDDESSEHRSSKKKIVNK